MNTVASRNAGAGRAEDAGPIRVVLIEDNTGFAYFVNDILTRQYEDRFRVEMAETLKAGLAAMEKGPPDIVLLDLGLPDCRRLETFERTRAAAPGVPIIILTVLDDDGLAIEAMRAGAQDYLIKNQVNKPLLTRSIRYALERSRIERAVHRLSGRVLKLQDEERRRVARELHDTTSQKLAALNMRLTTLDGMMRRAPAAARAVLDEALAILNDCSHEVRTMSYLLHPPLLDELGLPNAIREYADGFAQRSGIRVDLEITEDLGRLTKDLEMAIFRVMQESLTNIHRHSGSRTASIRYSRVDGQVVLEVSDTGRGITGPAAGHAGRDIAAVGVGIAGMRERVAQLGGRFELETGPKGTRVRATLPIPEVKA